MIDFFSQKSRMRDLYFLTTMDTIGNLIFLIYFFYFLSFSYYV